MTNWIVRARLSQSEYEVAKEAKGDRTWREMILDAAEGDDE